MLKYGIKLWTVNKAQFKEAVRLFDGKKIDFVELYIVPDSFKLEELELFKKVTTNIHTPHSAHNFNIFDLDKNKIELFKNQVIAAADFLVSKRIILHAGTNGNDQKIFKDKVDEIYDERIIIENMPKVSADKKDKNCFGYSREHLEFIKNQCGLDICLDFGHAVKSALSQKISYKDYIKTLIAELKPDYFHLNDVKLDNEKDEHLNLGEGELDLGWIKNILTGLAEKKDVYLVFEVPKNKNDLKNDIKNIMFFKDL